MKIILRPWTIIVLAAGMFTVLSGCVASGGYGGTVDVYGGDYYEPPGYVYDGWGPAYYVAPPRGDYRRPPRPANRPAQRVYRPAPSSRPVPSIPSHPRGGPGVRK